MGQHEVTRIQPLLDKNGCVAEPGWARELVWQYERSGVKVPKYRIKEWDYYFISNDRYGVAFTISDLAYVGMISVSVLDFEKKEHHTETVLSPMPMGKFHLGNDSNQGNAEFKNKRIHLKYTMIFDRRKIQCHMENFWKGRNLDVEIWLLQKPMDTMCIATPWAEEPRAFYYNQKINCMPASGCVRLGEEQWRFRPEDSMGVLDWGRGVWTRDNTWYWGSGSGTVDGVSFGFNLGYGFSDRSSATENVIFYNGKAHKLEDVTFCIPQDSNGSDLYMEPWRIISSDGRFEGDFVPIIDRSSLTDVKVIISDQHQVFGHFSGKVVLDDGRELKLTHFLCFFEKVRNKY